MTSQTRSDEMGIGPGIGKRMRLWVHEAGREHHVEPWKIRKFVHYFGQTPKIARPYNLCA